MHDVRLLESAARLTVRAARRRRRRKARRLGQLKTAVVQAGVKAALGNAGACPPFT